jgi:LCP family protein required for cell wall assembly
LIKSKYNKTVGRVYFDYQKGVWNLENIITQESITTTNLEEEFENFINSLELKSKAEKKVMSSLKMIEQVVKSTSFKQTLDQYGLRMSSDYRENNYRYFFDLKDKSDQTLKTIVLEKATGIVTVTNADGSDSKNLIFFDTESKKKTLEIPEDLSYLENLEIQDQEHVFNLLITGKHGELVDTMIFAQLNHETREIRMISVPRDLYYEGRKINSYPFYYGMRELKKLLSKISGYEIDKYVLIDMYAFIEVVDLIGGIEVTLEEELVDPYYRIVDENGKEGSLNYQPGTYHLGGKEALRLARSRQTSSDFARAARQQLILEAAQEKVKSLGLGDIDVLYEIAETVLSMVETDVSFDEAIGYYYKYKDYKIVQNEVLSPLNVLHVPDYTTVSQCARLNEEADKAGLARPGCENSLKAYTLAPKDNNWNLIKWYFQSVFEK